MILPRSYLIFTFKFFHFLFFHIFSKSPFDQSAELRNFQIYAFFTKDVIDFIDQHFDATNNESKLRTTFAAASLIRYIGFTSKEEERYNYHQSRLESMALQLAACPDLSLESLDKSGQVYWWMRKVMDNFASPLFLVEEVFQPTHNFPQLLGHALENGTNAMLYHLHEEKKKVHPFLSRYFSKNRFVRPATQNFIIEKLGGNPQNVTPQAIQDSMGFKIMSSLVEKISQGLYREL